MQSNWKKELLDWIKSFVLALAIVLFVKYLVFDIMPIDNISMQPTLYGDDRVFVNILEYKINPPKNSDVIIFTPPIDKNSFYIKRVIAVPGDNLRIQDGMVYVNNILLKEQYISPGTYTKGNIDIKIAEGTVFVMGDNRNNSEDSRGFGPIPISSIRGHAVMRVYPLSNIKNI